MVVVIAGVGIGGRVGSGVSLGVGANVTPVVGSLLGAVGVVDGSPCATGAVSGSPLGCSVAPLFR